MTTIAIIGNTSRNIGAATAADLALAGHRVRYAVFPEQAAQLKPIQARGGFVVQGDPEQLVSHRSGFAELTSIGVNPIEALEGTDLVLLDVHAPELEKRFVPLIGGLERNTVVHVQSHGYWPAARVTPYLIAAGRDDVLVTEACAPTIAADVSTDGVVTAGALRRDLEIATVPGERINEAIKRLRNVIPYLQAAPSVLQTGLENFNLLVHPAMALLGVGLCEQAEARHERIRFYDACNVPSAGLLADALDDERASVCAAYGVRHRSLPQTIDTYYGTSGANSYDAVKNCGFYQSLGPMTSTVWRGWMSVDVPYGVVPLVLLAEQAGLKAPLHRGLADIMGVVLKIDPWTTGPTLSQLGLEGSVEDVVQYARYGKRWTSK